MRLGFVRPLLAAVLLSGLVTGGVSSTNAETLYESLSAMIASHKRLMAAKSDLESAKSSAVVSSGAWYPTLDVKGHYGYEIQRKDEGVDDTHMPTREIGFTITQLLYDFGSTGGTIDQSKLNVLQTEVAYEFTKQALILEGITAHFGLISANKILGFARGSEANIKRQTELEDARVKRGSGFSTDVLQAKAQLAGAQTLRSTSEGQVQAASYRYRAVFGQVPDDVTRLKSVSLPLDLLPESVEVAVELALKNNLQIKLTEIASAIARSQTKKAESDGFYPKFNLIGENKYKQDAAGTIGFKGEQLIKVEGSISFNLGGTSFDTLESSKQAYLASENRLADARDLIAEQVRNGWQQLETARSTAKFKNNEANIASEFLELARKERRLGRRSLIDVLAGETALINASSEAAAAENGIAVAVFALLSVLGQLELDVLK
jgi:adhesin transport system outer membrane protein